MSRNSGKTEAMKNILQKSMKSLKPGENIMIISGKSHTVITRNSNQIEDKRKEP